MSKANRKLSHYHPFCPPPGNLENWKNSALISSNVCRACDQCQGSSLSPRNMHSGERLRVPLTTDAAATTPAKTHNARMLPLLWLLATLKVKPQMWEKFEYFGKKLTTEFVPFLAVWWVGMIMRSLKYNHFLDWDKLSSSLWRMHWHSKLILIFVTRASDTFSAASAWVHSQAGSRHKKIIIITRNYFQNIYFCLRLRGAAAEVALDDEDDDAVCLQTGLTVCPLRILRQDIKWNDARVRPAASDLSN